MNLKDIVIIFVSVIVGIAFLTVIGNKTSENVDLSFDNITNETITVVEMIQGPDINEANDQYTLANDDFSELQYLITYNSTILTSGTDFILDSSNNDIVTITFLNTTQTQGIGDIGNYTNANYHVYPDNYVRGNGAARTILNLNTLWYVLAIFMIVAGAVWRKYQNGTLF